MFAGTALRGDAWDPQPPGAWLSGKWDGVREDYGSDGSTWSYLPMSQALLNPHVFFGDGFTVECPARARDGC